MAPSTRLPDDLHQIIAGIGNGEHESNILDREGPRTEARRFHHPRFQHQIYPILGHPKLIRQERDLSPSKVAYHRGIVYQTPD